MIGGLIIGATLALGGVATAIWYTVHILCCEPQLRSTSTGRAPAATPDGRHSSRLRCQDGDYTATTAEVRDRSPLPRAGSAVPRRRRPTGHGSARPPTSIVAGARYRWSV